MIYNTSSSQSRPIWYCVSHSNYFPIPSVSRHTGYLEASHHPCHFEGKLIDNSSSYRYISIQWPSWRASSSLTLVWRCRWRFINTASVLIRPELPPSCPWHTFRAGLQCSQPPSRTVALAVDFSDAFLTVNHHRLLGKINHSHLNNNLIRWVSAYLHGRLAQSSFRHSLSPFRHLHCGVLYVSVSSPHLYLFRERELISIQCQFSHPIRRRLHNCGIVYVKKTSPGGGGGSPHLCLRDSLHPVFP